MGSASLRWANLFVQNLNQAGGATWTLAAIDQLVLDAAATDNTTTSGVFNMDVDSGVTNNKGIDLNYESLLTNNLGTETQIVLNIIPVQGSTGVGGTHELYGAYIQNLGTSGTPTGTNTEYGLRIELI